MKIKVLLAVIGVVLLGLILWFVLDPTESNEVTIESSPELVEVQQLMDKMVRQEQSENGGP